MAARIVEFNALPKSVRERFIGCVTGKIAPAPLLVVESPYKAAIFGWIALAWGAPRSPWEPLQRLSACASRAPGSYLRLTPSA